MLSKKKSLCPAFFRPPATLAALFLAAFFFEKCAPSPSADFLASGIGERKTAALAALGQAVLNACTALFFDKKNAAATLDGEAFFDLADGQILNLKMPEGRLVLRGARASAKTRPEIFELKIFAGQAVFETSGGQLFKLEKGNVLRRDSIENGPKRAFFEPKRDKPDWLDGISSFENERLRNVFFELERQFDCRVKIAADLAALPFSGSFEHQNLNAALGQICRPTGLVFEQTGQKIVIKKSR